METATNDMGNKPSSCISMAKTSGYYGPSLGAAKSYQTLHYRDRFIGFQPRNGSVSTRRGQQIASCCICVAFDGRKLHGAELKYPTHEKELLAIKNALQKWHHYLENGLPITVITDHDSLKYMNTIQNPSKRMARWVDEFQQYTLVIKYRPGSQATVPDAISRRPDFLLNSMRLGREKEEEYIPYMRTFLTEGTLPQNDKIKERIAGEVDSFVAEDDTLFCKVREGIKAPYVEFIFRGDLMEKIHHIYHLAVSRILSSLEHGGHQWITIYVHLCLHVRIVKLTKGTGPLRKGRNIKLCRTRLISHFNAGESTSSASFQKHLRETGGL